MDVQMWDVRMQRPALTIEGPYICGQGVAFNPEATTLATAAWRAKNPLQVICPVLLLVKLLLNSVIDSTS